MDYVTQNDPRTARPFTPETGMAEPDYSPLARALDQLGTMTSTAGKILSELNDRLQPIMRPAEPSPIAHLDDDSSGPNSEAVTSIHQATDDVRRLVTRMQTTLDHLEV